MADELTIKAIPTKYKGFKFRSRLEARWARFLDALGVEWEYEKEGYDLGGGLYYLPDFYLPEMDAWLEIKGMPFQDYDETWRKAVRLAYETEQHVYVFVGQFTTAGCLMGFDFCGLEDETGTEVGPARSGFRPSKCWWFQCPKCRRWQLGRFAHNLPCDCFLMAPSEQDGLVRAIIAAKQARFEHGESG